MFIFIKKEEKGFTLVEVLIGVLLISTIILLAFSLMFSGIRSFNLGEKQLIIQQNIKLFHSLIHKELRNASSINLQFTSCEGSRIELRKDNKGFFYIKYNGDKFSDEVFTNIKIDVEDDKTLVFTLVFTLFLKDEKEHIIRLFTNNNPFEYNNNSTINLNEENAVLCYTPVFTE